MGNVTDHPKSSGSPAKPRSRRSSFKHTLLLTRLVAVVLLLVAALTMFCIKPSMTELHETNFKCVAAVMIFLLGPEPIVEAVLQLVGKVKGKAAH